MYQQRYGKRHDREQLRKKGKKKEKAKKKKRKKEKRKRGKNGQGAGVVGLCLDCASGMDKSASSARSEKHEWSSCVFFLPVTNARGLKTRHSRKNFETDFLVRAAVALQEKQPIDLEPADFFS